MMSEPTHRWRTTWANCPLPTVAWWLRWAKDHCTISHESGWNTALCTSCCVVSHLTHLGLWTHSQAYTCTIEIRTSYMHTTYIPANTTTCSHLCPEQHGDKLVVSHSHTRWIGTTHNPTHIVHACFIDAGCIRHPLEVLPDELWHHLSTWWVRAGIAVVRVHWWAPMAAHLQELIKSHHKSVPSKWKVFQ